MKIKRHVLAGIEKHAWESFPKECCGLLAGNEGRIEHLYRLVNVASAPETHYFADPAGIFQAQKIMRGRGEKLLGIYHSHPQSPAYPSPTDIRQAYYPEAAYFIISLSPKLELRAHWIRTGEVHEISYEIVDDRVSTTT